MNNKKHRSNPADSCALNAAKSDANSPFLLRSWFDHFNFKGCYINPVAVNPATGFSSLNTNADTRSLSVMRFFCVRAKPCCAQIMVGRNGGASALAGLIRASLLTLLRPATPFSSGEVRLENFTNEATDMVTTPTPSHPVFIWRFFSCQKQSLTTHTVAARPEREVRSLLPSDWLVFAALVRAEVAHG